MTWDLKEIVYNWLGQNDELFIRIYNIRGSSYDSFMQGIVWLGNPQFFPYYLLLLACWVGLHTLFKIATKQTYKYYLSSWRDIFVTLMVGYAAFYIVIYGLQQYFDYPKPYVVFQNYGHLLSLEMLSPQNNYNSFPSERVAFTTFMLLALWPLLGIWQLPAIILIALMAWSCVSLGVNFPADVVAALVITITLMMILKNALYILNQKLTHYINLHKPKHILDTAPAGAPMPLTSEKKIEDTLKKHSEYQSAMGRQRFKELQYIIQLQNEMKDWDTSNHIRAYLASMAASGMDTSPETAEWFNWVTRYANHLDPTNEFRIELLDAK